MFYEEIVSNRSVSCPRSEFELQAHTPCTEQFSSELWGVFLPARPQRPTFNPPGEQLLRVRARQLLPRVSSPVWFHLAQGEQIQEKETCWLAIQLPQAAPLWVGGPPGMLCG